MKRKQCLKCPWKVSTNPYDISNGYCSTKHKKLQTTIAQSGDNPFTKKLNVMACHETPIGKEVPCVGWLANQLGPGNNIGLRIAAMTNAINPNYELDGEQHPDFESTLP